MVGEHAWSGLERRCPVFQREAGDTLGFARVVRDQESFVLSTSSGLRPALNRGGGAPRVEVLHGVSLTINAGEFAALAGASGSGKSVWFRARRGVVERAHGWMNRFRRILVRREKLPETFMARRYSRVPARQGRPVFTLLARPCNAGPRPGNGQGGFFFAMYSEIMPRMRIFTWFVRIVLFLLLLGFAVKNDHVADLNFFFGRQWHLPLVFIILIAFGVGALLGVTATITSLLRQRREISRLRRQLERAGKALPEEAARMSEPL
jgi:uncharacterized integral membrane protein